MNYELNCELNCELDCESELADKQRVISLRQILD